MRPELLLGVAIIAALTLYVLLGGADYGGGVWELLSGGIRARQQRETIARAIAPVWEVNHIWLILVIVLLWTGFPPAFAAITTALHIPLLVLLLGIICRGMSFTFRSYDTGRTSARRLWGYVFSSASIISPFVLGVVTGAITEGRVQMARGQSVNGFLAPWLAPFPLVVGGFAVALFAYLAAAYLTLEAREVDVREDFRTRALYSAVAVAVFALLTFLIAVFQVPAIKQALLDRPWSWIEHVLTAAAAAVAFCSLLTRKFRLARVAAAAEVSFILWGWALAQYPFLVRPGLTLQNSAAPPGVERDLLLACIAGSLVLFPSMFYLLRVFKRSLIRV